MPNLHAHYHHGNIKAFRQELDGTGSAVPSSGGGGRSGTSAGKSWTMSGMNGVPVKADPNERDQYGRTVLHLAASAPTQTGYTFFSILLRKPHISVNLQDYESGYTALHRALFVGNIRAARDLLARHDIDASIVDSEGLTAIDLYNGTLDGTNPPQDAEGTDLYVWGVNRNFALGIGDSSDKAYPDRVNLITQSQASGRSDPTQRFNHVGVKDVSMAKLHTGVVTAETRGNLSLCGFGSNGRLGRTVHSQLSLLPLQDLPHTITSIALAQDHSLALTSGGYILSWGHNRFAQLGYVIDPADRPTGSSKDDQEIQISPKRIVGLLKKEWVNGVAAGRMSSACWTEDSVWTWGTNAGHLGYEKAANPVQVLPRKVTVISTPVIDIALSDYAMICLLDSHEVLCFHHDVNFRISFTTPRILSDGFPFRPPQSTIKPMIEKVTSCGTTFAALSSIGDVFTFALQNPLEDVSKDARDRHVTVKPQLIWALRKSFTAVKDVALGSDGTVIICTHSGHVFVRQRVKSGSGQLKFRRIPYLQRVIKVAVNESGAFAAVRVDARATFIALSGKTLEEDMSLLQPHFRRFEHQMTAEYFDGELNKGRAEEDEEDEGSNSVTKDTTIALRMCTILMRWRAYDTDSLFSWSEPLVGSDVTLKVGSTAIPAHSVILSLRVPAFEKLLSGVKVDRFSTTQLSSTRSIVVKACHPLVVLLLLEYIYSDDIAAIWDSRVTRAIQGKFGDLKLPFGQIRADLKHLADILDLAPLSAVLSSNTKMPLPRKTLPYDLHSFFSKTALAASPSAACDVTLILADKQVACSSVILRARCPFFEAMFADSDWTAARHGEGTVTINMEHLRWRPMKLVFKFIDEGMEDDLFDYLHQETLDEFLDFVFAVLAAATELLLDRLVLICSRAIIRHCNAYNAAALACEAAFYQATTLKLSIFDYIISCMETMLESGLLDDMEEDVLLDLSRVISEKQGKKLSVSRSGLLIGQAMEKHREWLAVQDIPTPKVRQPWRWKPRSPVLTSTTTVTPIKNGRRNSPSPVTSPELRPTPSSSALDDIFAMDDEGNSPSAAASGATTPRTSRPMTPLDLSAGTPGSRGPVWKSRTVETERVDLRSIMAETATSSKNSSKSQTRPGPLATPTKTPSSSGRPAPASGVASTTTTFRASASVTAFGSPLTTSPWQVTDASKPSLASVQAQQAISNAPVSAATPKTPAPTPQRTSSARVITPVKLAAAQPGVHRKTSQGAAWTTAAGFAPPPPVPVVSPDSRSFSLLAIQQEERAYASRAPKPMKSFAEIQEEERGAKQSHAEEGEFMRWWQEEEARVSSESGANGNTKGQRGGRGVPRGHQRRVPNRGRGRGVGQSGQAEAGGRGRKPEAPSKQAVSTGNPVRS